MARRGLNNVVREKHVRNGQETWKLSTPAEDPVPAFNYFCEKNAD